MIFVFLQDVTAREGVTEASEEPPSDSTTTQSKSSTEVTAPPLDSLAASSDANQQNELKHKVTFESFSVPRDTREYNEHDSICRYRVKV